MCVLNVHSILVIRRLGAGSRHGKHYHHAQQPGYALTIRGNPNQALMQNTKHHVMTHAAAVPHARDDVTQQRRQASLTAAKLPRGGTTVDQTYMNASDVMTDSLYSDSVKYYVLESVDGR